MNLLPPLTKKTWLIALAFIAAITATGLGLTYNRATGPSPSPSATPVSSPGSSQPRITWSQQQINLTLSPGEGASRDLTFRSNSALANITVQAVPAIANFLTIQPNSFASVPANQPQAVHIAFSIPAGTALGTYDGTIHIRSGSRTLPQMLKVVINVEVEQVPGFLLYENQQLGFRILYPVRSDIIQDQNTIRFFSLDYPALPPTFELEVFTPAVNPSSSQQDILVDIARERLGDNFIRVVRFTDNGVLVEADTINALHFFAYDSSKNKAVELLGRSPDFFSSDTFTTVSGSIRFF